jgi:deoxyribose-phosphate aldolase
VEPEVKPPLATFEDLACLIGLAMLRPDLTGERVAAGLDLARRRGLARACVRPSDIDVAVRLLEGSAVTPAAAVGFPHGTQTTAAKLYEARDLLRRGARELDAVVAIPNLLSREFQYVEIELAQLADLCHKEGARLTAILEIAYLTDELRIMACRAAEHARVDFVSTSTGFAPSGYTLAGAMLLRQYLPEAVGVEAAGGVRTLDQALEALDAGCVRVATGNAGAILDEWQARLDGRKTTEAG